MILTVKELKTYITTNKPDAVLEEKLQAIELLIRKETNNNFQQRNIRFDCQAMSQKLYISTNLLSVGDTVQISESKYDDGVYHIISKDGGFIELNQSLF